ncbi:MAG TPA: hypothetical protein VHD83_07525 [Puia sp.]|nr:hypothetical protein [Puia sp.]
MNYAIKEKLHQLIDLCDNKSQLEDIRSILQDQDSSYDWWDELSEEEQSQVRESEEQYERGEYITFSELMSQLDAKKKK